MSGYFVKMQLESCKQASQLCGWHFQMVLGMCQASGSAECCSGQWLEISICSIRKTIKSNESIFILPQISFLERRKFAQIWNRSWLHVSISRDSWNCFAPKQTISCYQPWANSASQVVFVLLQEATNFLRYRPQFRAGWHGETNRPPWSVWWDPDQLRLAENWKR